MKTPYIVLVSGKRYSGKDLLCDTAITHLTNSYQLNCLKLSHSDIVKQRYCAENRADLARMLADRSYKEGYRNDLIQFAQEAQQRNPLILSEWVLDKIAMQPTKPDLVFIADFRRKMEEGFFVQQFGAEQLVTIRVNSTNENREKRGWRYDSVKDQRYTECELDDKEDWHLLFHNDGTKADVERWVQTELSAYLQKKGIVN